MALLHPLLFWPHWLLTKSLMKVYILYFPSWLVLACKEVWWQQVKVQKVLQSKPGKCLWWQDGVPAEQRLPDSQPCFLGSPNFPLQLTQTQSDADACSYPEPAACQPITCSSSSVPCGSASCLWVSVTICLQTRLFWCLHQGVNAGSLAVVV